MWRVWCWECLRAETTVILAMHSCSSKWIHVTMNINRLLLMRPPVCVDGTVVARISCGNITSYWVTLGIGELEPSADWVVFFIVIDYSIIIVSMMYCAMYTQVYKFLIVTGNHYLQVVLSCILWDVGRQMMDDDGRKSVFVYVYVSSKPCTLILLMTVINSYSKN